MAGHLSGEVNWQNMSRDVRQLMPFPVLLFHFGPHQMSQTLRTYMGFSCLRRFHVWSIMEGYKPTQGHHMLMFLRQLANWI